MLWHYQLGHPNFVYIRKLFSSLINNNEKFFQSAVTNYLSTPAIPIQISPISLSPFLNETVARGAI